jgi:uncharacterized protein
MLADRLPITLDVRKAAMRGSGVSGYLKPLDLKRFRPLLASDEGLINVEMSFYRDEERRYLLSVVLEADVEVTCQRCLEPLMEHLASSSKLAVVWTDEEAAHLPKYLDPLLVGETPCDLWQVVEDELILALPAFSYHAADVCKLNVEIDSDPAPHKAGRAEKPNPFNVLGQLKPGKKH